MVELLDCKEDFVFMCKGAFFFKLIGDFVGKCVGIICGYFYVWDVIENKIYMIEFVFLDEVNICKFVVGYLDVFVLDEKIGF